MGLNSEQLWSYHNTVPALTQSGGLRVVSRLLILAIHFYQRHFSALFAGVCKYEPSCSNYAIHALRRYGAAKGSAMTIRRLLRCRPPYPGGHDPVI